MPPKRVSHRQYRCRYCGTHLNAWLPAAQCPEASMLLYHLGQHHRDQVGPYLARMERECISTVVVEAYEVIEG